MAASVMPTRQPFGILSDSKLRALQSTKNRQNALQPQVPQSLKRRAPSPEISDSENVDPRAFEMGCKRKRSLFDDGQITVKRASVAAPVLHCSVVPQPAVNTQRNDVLPRTALSHSSTSTAAGRSPTRSHGKLDRKGGRGKFLQPSLGRTRPSVSIAAALRGTVSHKKISRSRKPAPETHDERPKTWFFDIFEESEHAQEYRMCEWSMTQSSAALDISDDESKRETTDEPAKIDKGKENVDPKQDVESAPLPAVRASTESLLTANEESMNTEVTRTPLSDLNAADYYAEGLTATSVALVLDEATDLSLPEQPQTLLETPDCLKQSNDRTAALTEQFTFQSERKLGHDEDDACFIPKQEIPDWTKRGFVSEAPLCEAKSLDASEVAILEHAESTIEVWESESAKDENEQVEALQQEHIVVAEGQSLCLTSSGIQVN